MSGPSHQFPNGARPAIPARKSSALGKPERARGRRARKRNVCSGPWRRCRRCKPRPTPRAIRPRGE